MRTTPRGSISRYLRCPVIPYVGLDAEQHGHLLRAASLVFLDGRELAELPRLLAPFQREPLAKVPLMLHLDLVDGLATVEAAVRYVATLPRIAGIVTVRHHLVGIARKLGLLSVVRLFPQDTRALERGLAIVRKARPDAVEILPGVAAIEVADRFQGISIPRIAGGLVRGADMVRRILDSGCRGVSASSPALWQLNVDARP